MLVSLLTSPDTELSFLYISSIGVIWFWGLLTLRSSEIAENMSSAYAEAMFLNVCMFVWSSCLCTSSLYVFTWECYGRQLSLASKGIMAILNYTPDKLYPCEHPELIRKSSMLTQSLYSSQIWLWVLINSTIFKV